ncbi:hypothetical protein V6N13_084181 [Hibiscus sabdariffa]|uniref:Uncharacterized protein n=1 Tax=Hibiscus sabdariffa TaxID=183260 RepID=A0ABR2T0L8_9ROSI
MLGWLGFNNEANQPFKRLRLQATTAIWQLTLRIKMSKEKPDRFQAKGKQQEIELESVVISKDDMVLKPSFEHSCLTEANRLNKPNADAIMLFFRIFAICHTAIPELNEETSSYTYESESADERAFLVAAREPGFEFF